jgi:precorrin-8X/cobalt-precorrin-8 methylmutase
MVACGIRGYWGPLAVAVEQPGVGEEAEKTAATRASMGMRQLQHLWNQGIVVVGNAPTALLEVLRLSLEGSASPMLVVGMPVGFVGAAESKDELVASGIPYITLLGTRGGSPMAAAAVNALIRAARRGE